MLFRESKQYLKAAQQYMNKQKYDGSIEEAFLSFVINQTPKRQPQ